MDPVTASALIGAGVAGVKGIVSAVRKRRDRKRAKKDAQEQAERELAINKQLMDYANAQNIANWQSENEYNSPKAQMLRYQAAGLNPNLIYGQSNMAGDIGAYQSAQYAESPDYTFDNSGFDSAMDQFSSSLQSLANHSIEVKQRAILDEELASRQIDNESKRVDLEEKKRKHENFESDYQVDRETNQRRLDELRFTSSPDYHNMIMQKLSDDHDKAVQEIESSKLDRSQKEQQIELLKQEYEYNRAEENRKVIMFNIEKALREEGLSEAKIRSQIAEIERGIKEDELTVRGETWRLAGLGLDSIADIVFKAVGSWQSGRRLVKEMRESSERIKDMIERRNRSRNHNKPKPKSK